VYGVTGKRGRTTSLNFRKALGRERTPGTKGKNHSAQQTQTFRKPEPAADAYCLSGKRKGKEKSYLLIVGKQTTTYKEERKPD